MLNALLSIPERRSAVLLLGILLIVAIVDALGVASIMPFIAVVSNPELLETNDLLFRMFSFARRIGVTGPDQFLIFLGLGFFTVLITSLCLKAYGTFVQLKFINRCEYSIGLRLLEHYLGQPYEWVVGRNSAELSKTILSEVNAVVFGALYPFILLAAHSLVAAALILLLLAIDPILACVIGLSLSIIYLLIFRISRGHLDRLGRGRIIANEARFVAVSEAFGAFKELKLLGLEDAYLKRFAAHGESYANNRAASQIVGQLPRFGVEALAFGGLLGMIILLMLRNHNFLDNLPVIALYVFAGYRLMPALQQVYSASTQIRASSPALESLFKELRATVGSSGNEAQDIRFESEIRLDQVSYKYPGSSSPAVKKIDLSIPAKTSLGIVGVTGGGKTTLADLVLGLLEPSNGSLTVDGVGVSSANRRAWQKKIGYVPQQIYLTDNTVARNIAFCQRSGDIDLEAVKSAAKMADLHRFIMNELPEQYETHIGELGVRLSGGQKQRIGIARALFRNPELLVFDEATSALDNLTEKAISESLGNLKGQITTITIAHRLSTVKNCDNIIIIENGRLKAQGTFDQLLTEDPMFKRMTLMK